MSELKNAFRIHLTGWVLIFLLFLWIFYEGNSNAFSLAVPMTLCAIPIFYSHYYILVHYWNKKRVGLYIAGLMVIFLVWSFLFDWMYRIFPGIPERFPIIIFSVIISGMANGIKNWFFNAIEREKREKQSIQTELNYLKSQINPHFLFNTLNNIHALAYKNSSSTPDAILRLSSLMRYMLYESSGELVALESEINYLKDYISLQQLRYRNESIVDLQIIGDTKNFSVAPLIFIHLLENAYKHSPAKLNSGDIKVGIGIKENSLSFSIQNPVGGKKAGAIDEPGGIGLSNIKRRLQLLYKQYTFEVNNTEEVYNVFLEINRL
jgi:sensor histidine kinase YesM